MLKCWKDNPDDRPTFTELASLVERLLTFAADYTELKMVLSGNFLDESGVFEKMCTHDCSLIIESEIYALIIITYIPF